MVELLPRTHCVGALNCVFTICRIGKRREGSKGAGGGWRASSQPRGLRPYGTSTSPALYCTPCCFNQWQACSQDTENRGYCTVSVGFFSAWLFLSCFQKTFELDFTCAYILFVDYGYVWWIWWSINILYFIYLFHYMLLSLFFFYVNMS